MMPYRLFRLWLSGLQSYEGQYLMRFMHNQHVISGILFPEAPDLTNISKYSNNHVRASFRPDACFIQMRIWEYRGTLGKLFMRIILGGV